MICPECKKEKDDQWPDGTCQECWEKQVDEEWWNMVVCIETGNENDE